MTERHDVPGGWVDLREPGEVPERLRQPVKIASLQLAKFPAIRKQAELQGKKEPVPEELELRAVEEMGNGGGELAFRMTQLNILARVAAWSFAETVTLDSLLDLPAATYDRLEELCGSADGLSEDLTEPNPDPDSPTSPSTA